MTQEVKINDIDDAAVVGEFQKALFRRKVAWEAKTNADKLVSESNGELLLLLTRTGYGKVEDERLGSVTRVESSRSSLDKNKLKDALMRRGVPVSIITQSIEEASTTTASLYVKYMPPKE